MRKQRGMAQAEVARVMGVSQARLSRMERVPVRSMDSSPILFIKLPM
jgi:transcriptional regulator with XRE-family HTH domain